MQQAVHIDSNNALLLVSLLLGDLSYLLLLLDRYASHN